MNELEHFSLRWNNFHSNMTSGFSALLQEDALVDVTLAAEGRILQAHKLVLSVSSPYFKQLFAANPCKHPIVILKDVHHKQLSDLLNFMYQGEVNVRQEELATFLKTAELLQIKGLTEQDPQSSRSQMPHGFLKEDRQNVAVSKTHNFPKFRQGPVRRTRHLEKPIPLAPLSADALSSPAPSPPPNKRIRPAASPVALSDDNEKQDEGRDTTGNEDSVNESNAFQVKLEPSSDFDGLHCSNVGSRQNEDGDNSIGEKKDSILHNAIPFSTINTPLSPHGTSQEIDESMTIRRTQRLSAEFNTSVASSSGVSITSAENSTVIPDNEQGELYYMTSKRGRLHLLHDGHRYYLHRQGVSGTRFWRCLRHRTSGCRAYVSVEQGAKSATKRGKEHNHTPPYERLDHNWIPVPMKLLSGNLYETSFFKPEQAYYDMGLKEHPENDMDPLAEMNFLPENDRIELSPKTILEDNE